MVVILKFFLKYHLRFHVKDQCQQRKKLCQEINYNYCQIYIIFLFCNTVEKYFSRFKITLRKRQPIKLKTIGQPKRSSKNDWNNYDD